MSLYDEITLPDNTTHIRLLHLHPSRHDDDEDSHMSAALTCAMSVIEIDSPPKLLALSYTRGPP